MQHGDIQVRISLSGEPQKLVTYWRGCLRDNLPTEANVTILRPRPKGQHWWLIDDPSFHFETMTRAENKRAELSISERSIATARELTEKLFDWLSQRQGIPPLNLPIANARISLRGIGGPEMVSVIESLSDLEVLLSVEVGAVYAQGEPRRPDVRWLPRLTSADKAIALRELQFFEKSLADGQGTEVRALIDRIAKVFRKRLTMRKATINKRLTDIFGYGQESTIEGEPISDKDIEEDYEDILAWLEARAIEQKPKGKIRAWRSSE